MAGFSVSISKCNLGKEQVGDQILAYDGATFNVVRDFVKGKTKGKVVNRAYGVEDPTVQRIQLCPRYNTASTRALIKKTTAALVAGKVKAG